MFDHHRLLRRGATAQGVVTGHKEIAHEEHGGEVAYSLRVRVRFEDGTETEIVHRWTRRAKVGVLRVGDKVPVRYDPDDHSKAVLDMPALEAAHARKTAEAEAALKRYEAERIAKAQAEIARESEGHHRHRP